jgi:hypothetical protein
LGFYPAFSNAGLAAAGDLFALNIRPLLQSVNGVKPDLCGAHIGLWRGSGSSPTASPGQALAPPITGL